jgi:biopolymer transport protein TolR
VNDKGQIFIMNSDAEIAIGDLLPKLEAITKSRGGGLEERIYVRGDKKVDYGTVMKVMGRLSQAGYRKVALITETEQ